MTDDLNEDEKFSDDPEEQLKIENDILKLKLQAELGGSFTGEDGLSPDIENAFLKNVLEFEQQFANSSSKTVMEILENPVVEKESNLNDTEIENALVVLEELMEQKGIVVDYCDEYDKRVKYKFITEELFYHEAAFVNVPGMTMHYIYEEFHPNHTFDIKDNAQRFFRNWTDMSFDENSFELARELVLDNGTVLSRNELLQKMQWMFNSYARFDNTSSSIDNVSFEFPAEGSGLGFVEGTVSYDAVLENGEVQQFGGPYKLYLQYENWWNIFFFYWPGFKW